MFVSISQVIGCEDRLQNDLYCVGWGVKLCSTNQLVNELLYIICHQVIFGHAVCTVAFIADADAGASARK